MAKKYPYKPVKSSYNSKKIDLLVRNLVKRRKEKIKTRGVKRVKVKKVKY